MVCVCVCVCVRGAGWDLRDTQGWGFKSDKWHGVMSPEVWWKWERCEERGGGEEKHSLNGSCQMKGKEGKTGHWSWRHLKPIHIQTWSRTKVSVWIQRVTKRRFVKALRKGNCLFCKMHCVSAGVGWRRSLLVVKTKSCRYGRSVSLFTYTCHCS